MNSSAKPPPRPPDPASARACLATNLMVFPGLGTHLAERRGGLAQMALALLGLAALVGWGLSAGVSWSLEGRLSWGSPPWPRVGLAGLALSFASWLWSLASGLAALRDAKRAAREKAVAPPRAP